jgi:hypothetical protein
MEYRQSLSRLIPVAREVVLSELVSRVTDTS